MWPTKDSSWLYTIFTGRTVRSASSAAWIWMERSSRPPNAPPTPARWIRTCSGGRSRHRRDLVAVDVEPLGRDVDVDAALAVRDREPGFGAEKRLILLAGLVDPETVTSPSASGSPRLTTIVRMTFGRAVAAPVPHRRTVGMERLELGRELRVGNGVQRLVLDARTAAAARRACSGSSAATTATASPKYRTRLKAKTG